MNTTPRAATAALVLSLGLLLPSWGNGAMAHEFDPHIVHISERGNGDYAVQWTAPVPDDAQGMLVVPERCTQQPIRTEEQTRWFQLQCGPSGLASAPLRVRDLPSPNDPVLLDIRTLHGDHSQHLLRGETAQVQLPDNTTALDPLPVAQSYLTLGIEHLLFGPDHLLFVLGLLMLIRGHRKLIGAATAFTAGHALTLCLSTLGWVHLRPGPVEASIALSLVWLAREIALHDPVRGDDGPSHSPWLAAGGFGLLHGLGFAGALSELGLPEGHIPLALASFNVGIEIAQLGVIAIGLGLASAAGSGPGQEVLWRIAPYGMGAVAMFWLVTRSLACMP
ncbi:MAG: HupE/UreJ family protein [Myxococcota bacterium]